MSKTESGGAHVEVQYEQPDDEGCPPKRQWVRKALRAALLDDAEVTVRFVGEAESRELNRRYLGKDRAANVLAFPYHDADVLTGDIAICPAVVEKESRAAGIDAAERYTHLLVHAALHLRGMTHDGAREAAAMERKETEVLASIGMPPPYREEA